MAVSPSFSNIIETLHGVHLATQVFAQFPGFELTGGWHLKKVDEIPHRVICKFRSIEGRTFKAYCKLHGSNCALVVNYHSRLRRGEATCVKWALAGLACTTAEQHMKLTHRAKELFETAS